MLCPGSTGYRPAEYGHSLRGYFYFFLISSNLFTINIHSNALFVKHKMQHLQTFFLLYQVSTKRQTRDFPDLFAISSPQKPMARGKVKHHWSSKDPWQPPVQLANANKHLHLARWNSCKPPPRTKGVNHSGRPITLEPNEALYMISPLAMGLRSRPLAQTIQPG